MEQTFSKELITARKRMRGSATFFIAISVVGLLGVGILLSADDPRYTDAGLFGRAFITIGIIFAAIAVWHGSRIAAVLILLFLLSSPLSALLGIEQIGWIDWTRAIIYGGIALFMIKSAFDYHRQSRIDQVDLRGLASIRWIGKTVSSFIVLILAASFAVLIWGTSEKVMKRSEISQEQLDWLVAQEFLLSGERPEYMYIDGWFSMADGGSLLTDKYVGAWWQEDGELREYWIPLGQVCNVDDVSRGSAFENAVYRVHQPGEGNWVELWLSTYEGRDRHFISRLKALNNRKMRPEIQKFCDEDKPIDWDEIGLMNGISPNIVSGDKVTEAQTSWLIEKEYLLEDEEIISFYSYGDYDIAEGGTLLTDAYFGGWFISNGEQEGWWGEIGSLCEIVALESKDGDNYVLVRVTAPDDAWVEMSLPAEGQQTQLLIDKVRAMNADSSTPESRANCLNDADSSEPVQSN